jgi:hypothetical protein
MLVGALERCAAVSQRHLQQLVAAPHDVDLDADLTGGVIETVRGDGFERVCREVELGGPVLFGHPVGDDVELAGVELSCVDICHDGSS